ncbi:MAG: response regulator transcription factor [Acidimicrobiales bacterium]
MVIADDDVIVQAGVDALLETVPGMEVVGRGGSLDELLAVVEATEPDVVLTDIRMPPTMLDEGVVAARRLKESHPDVGVVLLSQYVDPGLALAVLEHGSNRRGYLLKENVANVDQLVEALRSVAGGGSYIDHLVLDALIAARSGGKGTELDRLTAREVEVLAEMAAGLSNAAIAERLYVGERAIEKNVRSIFSKFDLANDKESNRRVMAVLLYLAYTDDRAGLSSD